MLDLGNLDLDEIASALGDQTDYEHRWLINPRTGEITIWTSDTGIDGQNPVDLDELDLVCIDPLPSYPQLLPAWYAFRDNVVSVCASHDAGEGIGRPSQVPGIFPRRLG